MKTQTYQYLEQPKDSLDNEAILDAAIDLVNKTIATNAVPQGYLTETLERLTQMKTEIYFITSVIQDIYPN